MIEVIAYEKIEGKGAKIGEFTIHIKEWDQTIDRLCEFEKGANHWISLPQHGKKDPHDPNKYNYFPTVQFGSDTQDKFLLACKNSLKEYKQKMYNTSNEGVASGGFPA